MTSAVVFVRNRRGELLLTWVEARGWDVPGGHVAPGEGPRQAAVRELREKPWWPLNGAGTRTEAPWGTR